jgi:hypothetical protein
MQLGSPDFLTKVPKTYVAGKIASSTNGVEDKLDTISFPVQKLIQKDQRY